MNLVFHYWWDFHCYFLSLYFKGFPFEFLSFTLSFSLMFILELFKLNWLQLNLNSFLMFCLLLSSVFMKVFSRWKREIWQFTKFTAEWFSIFRLFSWLATCFNLSISFLWFDISLIKNTLKLTIFTVKSSTESGGEGVLTFFDLGFHWDNCISFSLPFKDSKFTASNSFAPFTHS